MGTKTEGETCGGRPVRTTSRRVVVQLEIEAIAPLSELRSRDLWQSTLDGGWASFAQSARVLEVRANVIRATPVKRAAGRR